MLRKIQTVLSISLIITVACLTTFVVKNNYAVKHTSERIDNFNNACIRYNANVFDDSAYDEAYKASLNLRMYSRIYTTGLFKTVNKSEHISQIKKENGRITRIGVTLCAVLSLSFLFVSVAMNAKEKSL